MPGKTIARVIIVGLAGIALGGLIVLAGGPRWFVSTPPPLPPQPLIDAARGDPPAGVVAFEERVQTGSSPILVGSGFVLELPSGDVVGLTTAHSLGAGNFTPVIFTLAGREQPVLTFSELYAPLGQPRTGADLTVDYVIMRPDTAPDPAIILRPDPRGAPQPGERVALYSGLGDGSGNPRIFQGTLESLDGNGAWIRMDEVFEPGMLSGSPVISQHTGQVVGMTIGMNWAPGTLRIGVNPIGSILNRAASR
ncbi:MAG TPA: hypothetical protein VJG32_05230 [Anaerolineae bacterium]|nr:hypothetical protein [Anaerolineae bacterium]